MSVDLFRFTVSFEERIEKYRQDLINIIFRKNLPAMRAVNMTPRELVNLAEKMPFDVISWADHHDISDIIVRMNKTTDYYVELVERTLNRIV